MSLRIRLPRSDLAAWLAYLSGNLFLRLNRGCSARCGVLNCRAAAMNIPPHSLTPVPVLTASVAAGAKAIA